MLVEASILIAIYAIWIVLLVNVMVSSEEVSLTVATLPFIVTFPVALIVSAILEITLPGVFMADILLIVPDTQLQPQSMVRDRISTIWKQRTAASSNKGISSRLSRVSTCPTVASELK